MEDKEGWEEDGKEVDCVPVDNWEVLLARPKASSEPEEVHTEDDLESTDQLDKSRDRGLDVFNLSLRSKVLTLLGVASSGSLLRKLSNIGSLK